MEPLRTVWKDLDPEIRAKLDPQYVDIFDRFIRYMKPAHLDDWDGSARQESSSPYFGSEPVPVGSIEEIQLGKFTIGVLTPEGSRDGSGWPMLIWFHGGGFVLGNLYSEKEFLTKLCTGEHHNLDLFQSLCETAAANGQCLCSTTKLQDVWSVPSTTALPPSIPTPLPSRTANKRLAGSCPLTAAVPDWTSMCPGLPSAASRPAAS